MPDVIPLSAEEERTLRTLQERRQAAEAALNSTREERLAKVQTLGDLYKLVEDLVQEGVGRQRGTDLSTLLPPVQAQAGPQSRTDNAPDLGKLFPGLIERIDSLTEDVNRLAKKETDQRNGGIGYDHREASQRYEKDDPSKPRFNLTRAIYGHLEAWQGPCKDWPEREMIAAYQKEMQFGVSSSGGFLVAPQWMDGMIELLRPNLVLATLGARFRPLAGPTSFRKWGSGTTSNWTAEGKKIAASEMTVGRINLTPKPLATLVKVSDDLFRMGPAGLQGDIESDMARSQAEALDLAALKGQGGEGEPLGIMNLAGGTTDWGAAGPGGDQDYGTTLQNITVKLDDMVYQILARDVRGVVGFALGPLMLQKIRTTRDTTGHHIFFDQQMGNSSSSLSDSVEAGRLFGRPYAATSLLTSGTADDDIIAAVWSNVMVANFGPAEVFPSRHASEPSTGDSAYTEAETWIRVRQSWDVALTYPEAVQIATGADGTAP